MLLCLKHSAIFFFICNVHVYNVVQLSYVYFRYTFPVSILLSSSQWLNNIFVIITLLLHLIFRQTQTQYIQGI